MKDYIIDTNIVIALSKYNKVKDVKELMRLDGIDFYKAQSIAILYQKLERKEINCYILPLILDELTQGIKHHGFATIDYLQSSNIKMITNITEEQTELINDLGNFYFKYRDPVSKEKAFDTHEEKFNGKNDAFIMATCSVLGFSIITLDKHFTKKYFTIKSANKKFKQDYIKRFQKEDLVSENYDDIKIHKPTFIIKNQSADLTK